MNNEEKICEISINYKKYSGLVTRGTEYNNLNTFVLNTTSASITTEYEFCVNPEYGYKNNAKISATVPFSMSKEEIGKLNSIVETIKSDSKYKYEKKDGFDSDYYKYVHVYINGEVYAIKPDDTLLKELQKLIKIKKSNKLVYPARGKILGFFK